VGFDRGATERGKAATNRRTTVAEAAGLLGISAEAVRGRIRRGTLPVEREDGAVYVLLELPVDDRTTAGQSRTTDDRPGDRPQSDSTALISAKDETIATLRDQLEAERQAHSEARRIIAGLVERLPPQLEAPSQGSESPVTDPGRGPAHTPTEPAAGTHSEAEGAQRPWWRRLLGG